MDQGPSLQRIPIAQLRAMFNEGGYWTKVQGGELQQRVVAENHPTSPRAPVPYCTRSQYIAYLDASGQEVARVHQYLLPDGNLGASGRPDPKQVMQNGVLYMGEVNVSD